MTAVFCIFFVWHIIPSLSAEFSIGFNCYHHLKDARAWPQYDEEQQKDFLKELKGELSDAKWKANEAALELLTEDKYKEFMDTFQDQSLNPAELWAVKQYSGVSKFCTAYRSQWRENCDDLPMIYTKLLYTATHKPNRLDGAAGVPFYSGYAETQSPQLIVKEDKVNYGEQRLYGPVSTSPNVETAMTFADSDKLPTVILEIRFPKDADVLNFGFLNLVGKSLFKEEKECIFWDVPTPRRLSG